MWGGRPYGNTGNRTFFASQGGGIVATEDSRYSGPLTGNPLDAAAAFRAPGSTDTSTGQVATGTLGRDGNTLGRDGNMWKSVGWSFAFSPPPVFLTVVRPPAPPRRELR